MSSQPSLYRKNFLLTVRQEQTARKKNTKVWQLALATRGICTEKEWGIKCIIDFFKHYSTLGLNIIRCDLSLWRQLLSFQVGIWHLTWPLSLMLATGMHFATNAMDVDVIP